MYLFMYVCTYSCMKVYVYVYICMYTHIRTYLHACVAPTSLIQISSRGASPPAQPAVQARSTSAGPLSKAKEARQLASKTTGPKAKRQPLFWGVLAPVEFELVGVGLGWSDNGFRVFGFGLV